MDYSWMKPGVEVEIFGLIVDIDLNGRVVMIVSVGGYAAKVDDSEIMDKFIGVKLQNLKPIDDDKPTSYWESWINETDWLKSKQPVEA